MLVYVQCLLPQFYAWLCNIQEWNDVLVVFPLATYSLNKLRQISKLFEYTFAVKKSGDHLLPQKCVMMSFFIVKEEEVYM